MALQLQISRNFTARFQFERRNLTKNQKEPNKIVHPLHCGRKAKKHRKQISKIAKFVTRNLAQGQPTQKSIYEIQ